MNEEKPPSMEKPPADFIPHVFQLRRDLKITLPLPPDLSKKDVERIYRWMQTLPIEDEE